MEDMFLMFAQMNGYTEKSSQNQYTDRRDGSRPL